MCIRDSFVGDLRSLQNPQYRNGVLLRWGRDFAVGITRGDAEETSEDSATSTIQTPSI